MSAAEAVASHGLFRPEALEAQRRAALGRIQVNTPLAHRPETLASADRVIVLRKGRAESVVLRQEAEAGWREPRMRLSCGST